MIISRETLKDALDRAILDVSAPHLDVGPLLGSVTPVRIGFTDTLALLESGEPAFSLDVGDNTLTVRRQDGGMLVMLNLKW